MEYMTEVAKGWSRPLCLIEFKVMELSGICILKASHKSMHNQTLRLFTLSIILLYDFIGKLYMR